MLRKDVKLGLAIGGILLAVVLVYVLVVPGDRSKNVSVVGDDSQSRADGSKADVNGQSNGLAGGGDGKAAEPEVASANNAPPTEPPKAIDQSSTPATAPSEMAAAGSNDSTNNPAPSRSGNVDWKKLLSEGGAPPPMMSQTPTTPSADHSADQGGGQSNSQQPNASKSDASPADNATPVDHPTQDQVAAAAAAQAVANPDASNTAADGSDKAAAQASDTPATRPSDSSTAQRTHIVQPGEMLTSIAAAAYGDAKKWKKIAAANPDVNPNRMVPGTKLVIPVLASYTQPSSHQGSAASDASIDPRTQYEVQSGDSLYRISVRLYGKADHVDKLYSDNKGVIGDDPRRLKAGTILKLTAAPTNLVASAR
jgi:nucleoid-associated protein YgaU